MKLIRSVVILFIALAVYSCSKQEPPLLQLSKGSNVVLIGNNLGSRMMNYGYFETEVQLRYPDSLITIRNMCDGGNTAGFRPHPGRTSPWAFDGAEAFNKENARPTGSRGHFETPDEWLTRLKADVIIGFFGYNESFRGDEGIEDFRGELNAFIDHTLAQSYNGSSAPQLVLVSPIAFEDLSDRYDLPNGVEENRSLLNYASVMKGVCEARGITFVDSFKTTEEWFRGNDELTIDGSQLNDEGYRLFSGFLAEKLFGPLPGEDHREEVHQAVMEKNWYWHNDFKIPNGVHVYGRRYEPFGPDNYPYELSKIRQMTVIRDTAIWKALKGETMDLGAADSKTLKLPEVETNYQKDVEQQRYLYGEEALSRFTMADGYKIELFASEEDFENLANPVQLSFDNKGRLWVSVMPSYPHYKPGDPRPKDKLLILEDTDGDGKADKETVFADDLHLPIGFEFAPEGVYVSQGTNLVLLRDIDGDDKADSKEIILSGFDDHDTHHAISAFTADPSGALYMGEGVFLHSNVETSYGPVRATNGGFFRYDPTRHKLERTAQLPIPNPWGIAFDEWGQIFFAETSGPDMRWMTPGTVKPLYGIATHKSYSLIEEEHRVRPTSGLEFVYSRHFPEEVQGDILINNTIGFLGTKQHTIEDDGTGFKSRHRQDLLRSSDGNFRPVDMEFAPDGSLYLIDWHNLLVGHMQHNARDPLRDHVHGRVYRITYPDRPLVTPAKVYGATLEELFSNLTLPEYRTRYRSRRELRGRDTDKVLESLDAWIASLDPEDENYEQYLMEGLWVSWGANKIHRPLLDKLLSADDRHVRAAAVRVVRYNGHQLEDQAELLMTAAGDPDGRVRLEAIIAASWLDPDEGLPILEKSSEMELDDWMIYAHQTAIAHLQGRAVGEVEETLDDSEIRLTGADLEKYNKGKEIYHREGYCVTCHQDDGKGLPASGFPPLAGTKWVLDDEEVLIKLTLNGLLGPIEVLDRKYPGQVPMTPFRGLLDDEAVAAVLTYVRNSFGNEASVITADKVKEIRAATESKQGFYDPAELQQ